MDTKEPGRYCFFGWIFRFIVRVFLWFLPPPKWRIPVYALLGVFFGLFFTFMHVTGGTSYLSSDSEVCLNCHIMTPEYMGWLHGSHKTAAVCVDCHLPHDTFVNKWVTKGKTGMRHLYVWTTQTEPQVIRAIDSSKDDIAENCLRCHSDLLDTTKLVQTSMKTVHADENKLCWDCHRDAGHGSMSNLSLNQNLVINLKAKRSPDWIEKLIDKNEDK
ncbi:MAG: cytochrome c nitrite reductase small subunit [Planctomycetes bacterium]|nr:cytochrome c nitrite reductase small subunit [Planctomycetota bacterium]